MIKAGKVLAFYIAASRTVVPSASQVAVSCDGDFHAKSNIKMRLHIGYAKGIRAY